VAAMLLLTLRGTPTIYYGEELGMEQVPIRPEDVRDPFEHNVPGQGLGRDGCRTPMPWDDGISGGFSRARPWLPLAENFPVLNAAAQRADERSLYQLYRKLIALRKESPALQLGAYQPIVASGDLLLYVRQYASDRILVALNLGSDPAGVTFPVDAPNGRLLLSTHQDRDRERVSRDLVLRGNEGIIVRLVDDGNGIGRSDQ